MKFSIELKSHSSKEWLDAVMADFPSFLRDHADCERKASSLCMSLVAKYPDRLAIIPALIETALEELEHFQLVYALMQKQGIKLNHEIGKDLYAVALVALCKPEIEHRFLDRLILGSIMECRGAERFKMLSDALPAGELKEFYKMLWTTEAKHGNIFVKFALEYFDESKVYERLEELMIAEADILEKLPIKAALH